MNLQKRSTQASAGRSSATDAGFSERISNFKAGRKLFTFYLWVLFALACFVILVGVVACLGASEEPWQASASVVVIGWASWMVAGLLGVVFGIPRSLDFPEAQRRYWANDNLLTISDWLTKILVGFGLAQARELVEGFDALTEEVGNSLEIGDLGQTVVGGIILVCMSCGFLQGYLWARLYFTPLLEVSETFFVGRDRNVDGQAASSDNTGSSVAEPRS